jgi:hypothetical protein
MFGRLGTLVIGLEICLCCPHPAFLPSIRRAYSHTVHHSPAFTNNPSLHTTLPTSSVFYQSLRVPGSRQTAFLFRQRGTEESSNALHRLTSSFEKSSSHSASIGRFRMSSGMSNTDINGKAHRATGDEVSAWKRRVLVISGPTGVG